MTRRGPLPQLLLNLSGGVDSTYALWRLLLLGYPVVTHHVVLKSREGRAKQERDAVVNVLNWMHGQGLRPMGHVEQGYDYGSLRDCTRDIEIVRYMSGVVLATGSYRNVSGVVASGIANDPRLKDDEVQRIRRLLEDSARRPIGLMRPIRHLSKRDILQHMPRDLFNLAWYCRRPRSGRRCNSCRTCRHVMAVPERARHVLAANEGPSISLELDNTTIPAAPAGCGYSQGE